MLYAHYSNKPELLARLLAEVLRGPVPGRPVLEPDLLVVQNAGLGRWLQLQVAQTLGIAANLSVLFPAEFVWQTLQELVPDLPHENPFAPHRLAWWIFSLFDHLAGQTGLEPLTHYLAGSDQFKRWSLAGRLARLLDQYLLFRPDMIRDWENGEDGHWQAHLWRALVQWTGTRHWARLQGELVATVTSDRFQGNNLPARIAVFGIPSLSPSFLAALDAISHHAEVHLFWFNPCAAPWSHITTISEEKESGPMELHYERGNTLLAKWGKQGRDTLDLILDLQPREADLFDAPDADTLLSSVQQEICLLRDRGDEDDVFMPDPADHSITIHVCHSPMREVEVLHDQLLDRFARDAHLTPGDVLVLAPDISLYAPCIDAVFGAAAEHCCIPYAVADRNCMEEEPVVASFLALLDLPDGRLEAETVLGLLENSHIASRFSLDETALEQVRSWLAHTRVRWGRDGAWRKRHGFPDSSEHTWQAALDRLVLGAAMGEEEPVAGLLPYMDIEGETARMLGRFHTFATAVFEAAAALGREQPVDSWRQLLDHLTDVFFTVDNDSATPLQAVRQAVTVFEEVAAQAMGEKSVALPVVRHFLTEQFAAMPAGHSRFLTGAVTCCAMVPMRSIPFKLICMLGMGHNAFPRVSTPESMDLMARSYKKGDRSRRDDDRYLFLETLLLARHALYISYVGRDIRDDSEIPPSVLVSDLLDYLLQGVPEKGAMDDDGPREKLLRRLVTLHPLQPFDPVYFQNNGRYPGYSEDLLNACRGLHGISRAAPGFFSTPLAEPEESVREIELDRLVEFYCNPARALLRRRLGLWLERSETTIEGREPFVMDWDAAETARLEWLVRFAPEQDLDGLEKRLRMRNLLPHGLAGRVCLEKEISGFSVMAKEARQVMDALIEDPWPVDLEIDLPHDRERVRLVGWITGLRVGRGLVHLRLRRAQARDRILLVLHHLALSADTSRPLPPCSELLALDRHDRLRPVHPQQAREFLSNYINYFFEGQQQPLPFFPKSAWAYFDAGPRSRPMEVARKKWRSTYFARHGEDADPYYRKLFAGQDPVDARFERLVRELLLPLKEILEER